MGINEAGEDMVKLESEQNNQLSNGLLSSNDHSATDMINQNDFSQMNTNNIRLRRNKPGTSAQAWYKWTEEELDEMESTLAVQQYIQQLIRRDPSDVDSILRSPEQQDEGVWKYEQLRQFCFELNLITVRLQQECLPSVCNQMTATEQWIFLCAAHKNPKECSAIDYTRHTLDGAACLLNSNRYFPSRVNIKESSVQKLASVCRRIYRIFSHAYYHHRQIYDEFEKETSLCKRFTKFVLKYELMTSDILIVPINNNGNQDNSSLSEEETPSSNNFPSSTSVSISTTDNANTTIEVNATILENIPDEKNSTTKNKESNESDA